MASDLVAGDTGSKLRVTCIDAATKAKLDLTGKTVKLIWARPSNGGAVVKTMSVVDAPNGVAEYQFAANEIEAPQMVFDVKVYNADATVLSSLNTLVEQVREN